MLDQVADDFRQKQMTNEPKPISNEPKYSRPIETKEPVKEVNKTREPSYGNRELS